MPTADRIAFERLVADHHGRACAVAYAVLRDRARSENIAQDALLLAWERREQIPPHAAAWLCTIARNLARNAARRPRMVSLDADVADHGDPLHSMIEAEELRRAGAALAALPDDEREAIVLFYRCGATVRAIADAAGITDEAARKRLQRGRDRLRDQLGGVERRVERTRPAAAIAGACVAAWLARSGTAAAATATTPVAATAGKAKVVALGIAAAAVAGGAVMLARAVEPPAAAATVVAPPPAAPPPAAHHADPRAPALPAAAPAAPAAPPPIDPRYANVPFELFVAPDGYEWTAQNALDFMTQSARMPIYVDGVDTSMKLDRAAITGTTVGEVFDEVLAQLGASRTEAPGLRTTTFGPPPDSCATPFGGDRVDARYDNARDVRAVADMLAAHLRVPMFVAQRDWPITVALHGSAGEAFDQLVAASRMGCTVEPGYIITPQG